MGDDRSWVEVAHLDEIFPDRPLARSVGGIGLVLLRRDEQVVAVRDRCPHMDYPLREGRVVDGRLVCALHRWTFDVFDEPPAAVPPEARCVHVPVRVDERSVFVAVD